MDEKAHGISQPEKEQVVDLTRHAEKRIRQRLGINRSATEKNVERALEYGVTHAEASGSLCKYLDGVFLRSYRPTNMRVYNHSTYLFSGAKLITVLPLPRNLWPMADKLQRRKIDKEDIDNK